MRFILKINLDFGHANLSRMWRGFRENVGLSGRIIPYGGSEYKRFLFESPMGRC